MRFEQIFSAFRKTVIPDLQERSVKNEEKRRRRGSWPERSLINVTSSQLFLSFYIYIGTNDPCKNAVPATTLLGRPFTLCTVCKVSFIPPPPRHDSLLPPPPPSEPIKTERDNELHNSKFCVIVSPSASVPMATGTIRKERERHDKMVERTHERGTEKKRGLESKKGTNSKSERK